MSVSHENQRAASLPALAGVIPIVVTPFARDGALDLDQMGRQIDFLVECGVHWAGFGFGSEMPRLDLDEATALMQFSVGHAAGRLHLIGNAEMTSTRAGVTAVRRVADTGVDLAMVRPSGLAGAGQDALFEAFAEVSASSGIRCVVQDAPQNTGVDLGPRTLARLLAEAPGVAAVKVEPRPSAPKIGAIVDALAGHPGTIIGGAGAAELLHELDRGAQGTMPGPAFPDLLAEICRLHGAGRRADAATLFRDFLPLTTLGGRGMAAFLFTQKYILRARGVLGEPFLRAPHEPIDPRLAGEIDTLLEAPALRHAIGAGPAPRRATAT